MRNVQIDNQTIVMVASRYGTPCLCYEQSEIKYWAQTLRSALPETAKLIYSVKASPSPALITYYNRAGFYFETASCGELTVLINLGVSPDKIWVSGQGKTRAYLKEAVSYGVRCFNLESHHELEILAPLIANKEGYYCNLRINPKYSFGESVLSTAGESSAFGVDEEQMDSILLGKYGELINGIFVYAGSQLFHAEDIVKNTEYCFNLAKKFYDLTGRPLENVDFGGGFGVPEDECTEELDIAALYTGLSILFQRFTGEACFTDHTSFYFESGRYLCARTACLICSVVDIKSSRGQKYLVTDGGINCLGVKQKEYRLFSPYIRHIGQSGGKTDTYRIVGTTCTPIDMTHPDAVLCNPQIGDYICILDCGGYSLTFSPQNFNGLYAIAEVVHSEEGHVSFVQRGNNQSPCGQPEYVPIGTGHEIRDVLLAACPKESDEVQNIAVAAHAIRLNRLNCVVYDVSTDGTDAVILLKILMTHHQITPAAVFSDFDEIASYSDAPCFPTSMFTKWCSEQKGRKPFAMLVGSEYTDNNVSQAITEILDAGFRDFIKIESELIDSMEHHFYSYFLHHIAELQKTFDFMADLQSARFFVEYMRTVLENDFWRLEQGLLSAKYWGYDSTPPKELYQHLDNEVLLNVGACNGDTIFRFLQNGYSFSRIYAVDADVDALARCKANLKLLKDDTILNRMTFCHANLGDCTGQERIDQLFSDAHLSLINMDIEGAESGALRSASCIIQQDRPVLAICAYHRPDDLYALPQTIRSIVPDYRLFLRKYPNYPYHRYNSKEELVLYAVPPERLV